MSPKAVSLALLALCDVAAMALWFSAAAIAPALGAAYGIGAGAASLFTSSVQLGFVAGTMVSALLALADRFEPHRLFTGSALVAAGTNLALLGAVPHWPLVVVLRFVTGACMAGIYPVGIKMATTWAKGDMGFLIGVLVGALTLGSAVPHLFNAFGGADWRFTIAATSAVSAVAGLLVNLVRLGPNRAPSPRFDFSHAFKAFSTRSLRLANFGYFGHNWELFGMWAWLGVFLDASFHLSLGADGAYWARLATFFAIGIGGAVGCLAGGIAADRAGRTVVTIVAMSVSGACCLTVGFLFGGNPWALLLLVLVWGVSVVADSAQFSASIVELSDTELVGTMLTVQTCVGFLLTLVTIDLLPPLVAAVGWRYAFIGLALGPAFGIVAMARLRAQPDAHRLAGGLR